MGSRPDLSTGEARIRALVKPIRCRIGGNPTCDSCRFFRRAQLTISAGDCLSPRSEFEIETADGEIVTEHPVTHGGNWCREYEPCADGGR